MPLFYLKDNDNNPILGKLIYALEMSCINIGLPFDLLLVLFSVRNLDINVY